MSIREVYKTFMRHQLEFGIEEGIIDNIAPNDIEGVVAEFEDNPDFHQRMAKFLKGELDR